MPDPCLQHQWLQYVEIEPSEVSIKLDAGQITDVLHESEARELEEKGVLKVEDLPLFMGRGPSRVWTRHHYDRASIKLRQWKRTCSVCGFDQVTSDFDYEIVPCFRDSTEDN